MTEKTVLPFAAIEGSKKDQDITALKTSAKNTAESYFAVYDAYRTAGFSDDQSFELMLTYDHS